MKLFDLTGRTALVTGSSRGIGRSIAGALAEAGARVAVHASRESELLHQTVTELRASGATAEAFAANLADSTATKLLLSRIREGLGETDILVLNASMQTYQTLDDFTEEEFLREMAVNVQSSFSLIRDAVGPMKTQGWGRILAIGSVNQWKPSPRLPIYAATKAAQANLIVSCAKQYASFGITANNLAPGVIPTDRNREAMGEKATVQRLLAAIPAGRFGTVEECAALALLLCSDAGAYINGADIPVTGGMHL
ncbi:MAG: SDR family oxidoreductase [Kiritimatiellia bacterium]|nr:SDR family oxidoreductase [Kiritimatiellia bacterium]